MNQSAEVLFQLLSVALGNDYDYSLPKDINWREVVGLASEQGVAVIIADGLQRICDSSSEFRYECLEKLNSFLPEDLYYSWLGQAMLCELDYTDHKQMISELVSRYAVSGIKMMVVKGYASSLMYPIPEHRSAGDIDMYLYGKGKEADEIMSSLGVDVKQNEDRHSVFSYRGITVENHATFVNVVEYPSKRHLETVLKQEAKKSSLDDATGAYIPTPFFDALFLSSHFTGHFVYGGASLKQVVDWAVLAMRHGPEIDWHRVYDLADEAGYGKTLRSLNGIVVDYLGVPESVFPMWNRDKQLETRILNEILWPEIDKRGEGVFGKAGRFFKSSWKYKMVFREPMIQTFFHRSWALFREKHLPNSRSVWAK